LRSEFNIIRQDELAGFKSELVISLRKACTWVIEGEAHEIENADNTDCCRAK